MQANYDPNENIFGKTGTCTDFRAGSHMGWFGSFIESSKRPLVVVVMLTESGEIGQWVAGCRAWPALSTGIYPPKSTSRWIPQRGWILATKSDLPLRS